MNDHNSIRNEHTGIEEQSVDAVSYVVVYYPKRATFGNQNNKKKRRRSNQQSQDGILQIISSNKIILRNQENGEIVYNNSNQSAAIKKFKSPTEINNGSRDDEQDDDVITFGTWECQIISQNSSSTTILQQKEIPTTVRPRLQNSMNNNHTRSSKISLLSNHTIKQKSIRKNILRRPILSSMNSSPKTKPNDAVSLDRQAIIPSKSSSFRSHLKPTTTKPLSNISSDSSNKNDKQVHSILNSKRPTILMSKQKKGVVKSSFVNPKIASAQRSSFTTDSNKMKKASVKSSINIPPSIRRALRPHQQQGTVTYIFTSFIEIIHSILSSLFHV